jgi:outer membrane protein
MIVSNPLVSQLTLLCILSLLLIPIKVYADKLGVQITSGIWNTRYKGYVIDKKNLSESINLRDDLNLDNSTQSFFFIYLEQHVPSIPNIRIGKSNMSASGTSILARSFTYQGVSYSPNEKVNSSINLDHIEASLYWKLIDNDNKLNLGFTVKDFTGQVSITETASGSSGNETFEAAVPLIYLSYETDLPLTAYTVGVNSSFIGINRAYLYDLIAYVRYKTYSYVGVEAGYRKFQLNVNNDIIKTDITISGFYLNGFISF